MKKFILSALCALATTSAFATFCPDGSPWPKNPNGSWKLNSDGSHYCPTAPAPTPSPAPSPAPVTVTAPSTSTADADATAQAKADAAAKAAAAAISASLATGGAADANAVSKNWNSLSTAQQQALMASLNQNQKQALQAALTANLSNTNDLTNKVGIDGVGSGNGATVATTTNNTSSNKVLYVNLPTVPAVAPTVTASGGITMVGTCGPLKQVESMPIEYLLVGHIGIDKVQLSGQTTDKLVDVKDETGNLKLYDVVDNGDGTWSQYGSIASIAVITVSGSASKQFGLGLIGGSGGGNASNGTAGTVTLTQKVIVVGSCEHRKYKIVQKSDVPPVTKTEINDALSVLAGMQWKIDVPTQRIETDRVPCKMEKFTDADGKPVEMCRGPKGSYARSRVTNDRVSATGALVQGAAAGVKK